MTHPNNNDDGSGGWFGPSVEVWIDDSPAGQSLFVATTDRDGNETTAGFWQPNHPDDKDNQ